MTGQYRSPRSFDDLAIGNQLDSYGRTITETDVILFTGLAGIKLPIFLDEEYCKHHTPFGTRIVPGPLLLAFASAMIMDLIGPTTISGLGWDRIRFFATVRPGDTIHTRILVVSKRDTSDGERGILEIEPTVIDQHGTSVMSCLNILMMRKGPLDI